MVMSVVITLCDLVGYPKDEAVCSIPTYISPTVIIEKVYCCETLKRLIQGPFIMGS